MYAHVRSGRVAQMPTVELFCVAAASAEMEEQREDRRPRVVARPCALCQFERRRSSGLRHQPITITQTWPVVHTLEVRGVC